MDDDWLAPVYAANLVLEATGGNSDAVQSLRNIHDGMTPSVDDIYDALREHGVPIAQIVVEDAERAVSNVEPVYLLPSLDVVQRYRSHYRFRKPAREKSSSLAEAVEKWVERIKAYPNCYSSPQENLACPKEQAFFYNTDFWQRRAKVARLIAKFRCSRCGASNTELQVHHKEPIYSVFSGMFHRNFDTLCLETLCRPCHIELHRTHQKDAHEFVPRAAPGEPNWIKEFKEIHDRTKECRFCFPEAHEWETLSGEDEDDPDFM